MQLSYFFKNTPYLRVLIPSEIHSRNSYNEMLKNGIKEAFIIIPNVNGLVIHLSNLKFNSAISQLNDIISVGDTDSFLEFGPENIYLESNGVQILDNNGILLFKQDVEKYLYDSEKTTINEVIHETLLDLAVRIKFSENQKLTPPLKPISTSVDTLLNQRCPPGQPNCKSCIDRLAGVNNTAKRNRLNRTSPFRSRING